jgi:hypothetical protein
MLQRFAIFAAGAFIRCWSFAREARVVTLTAAGATVDIIRTFATLPCANSTAMVGQY